MAIKKIEFHITKFADLPTRAQNIVVHLGGIDASLIYYKKNKSFSSIHKCGFKTCLELNSYFDYLSNIEGKEMEYSTVDNEDENRLPDNILDCLDFYFIQKESCTVRVNNYLNKIEFGCQFDKTIENKIAYLKMYFINDFDYINEHSIGVKSQLEIINIRKGILSMAIYATPASNTNNPKQDIINEIYRGLNYKLEKTEIEKSIPSDGALYNFHLLLSMYLLKLELRETTKTILCNYYFSHSFRNLKELSTQVNVGQERVRQIVYEINKEIIPKTIDILTANLKHLINEVSHLKDKEIIRIFPEYSISSVNSHLVENNSYFIKLYSYLLRDKYLHINSALYTNQKILKSFIKTESCIFLSIKFLGKIRFELFIDWIDQEINNFEVLEFEYNLGVLIKRYFNEHRLFIDKQEFNDLVNVIQVVKKKNQSDIKINISKRRKLINKAKFSTIVDESYLFLKEKNKAQSTQTILDYLIGKSIEVNKINLLRFLNSQSSIFSNFGFGTWVLNEWGYSTKGIKSFVEITENLLTKRNDPIHISELYEYINLRKKVQLRSIETNLKVAIHNPFVFFNCSYIGLVKKKYAIFWSELPKPSGIHFNRNLIPSTLKTDEDIATYLYNKFGYPKQHVIFILERRQGKYQ